MLWIKQRFLGATSFTKIRLFLFQILLQPIFLIAFIPGAAFQTLNKPPTEYQEDRLRETVVIVMTSHWQLATWSGENLVCDLFLRHEQLPDTDDVKTSCGDSVLKKWAEVQLNGERIARILTRNSNRNDQRLPGEDMMIGFYFKI